MKRLLQNHINELITEIFDENGMNRYLEA